MSTHTFTASQVESLIRLLESSVDVKRRYQFYLWTQGDLQRLVPHKFSVCGSYDLTRRELAFDVLNSVPLAPEVVGALSDARSGVLMALVAEWMKSGGQPTWVQTRDLLGQDPIAQAILESGYEWLLTHAVCRPGRAHELESFFIFGLPGGQREELSSHALHLFLPYLHCTYVRVFNNECEMASPGRVVSVPGQAGIGRSRSVVNITEREREILRWVRDGKSNQAISDELGISALTVKNHVQKILRKLGASNRAQAVAKALMMNMFNSPLPSSPMVRKSVASAPSPVATAEPDLGH